MSAQAEKDRLRPGIHQRIAIQRLVEAAQVVQRGVQSSSGCDPDMFGILESVEALRIPGSSPWHQRSQKTDAGFRHAGAIENSLA